MTTDPRSVTVCVVGADYELITSEQCEAKANNKWQRRCLSDHNTQYHQLWLCYLKVKSQMMLLQMREVWR